MIKIWLQTFLKFFRIRIRDQIRKRKLKKLKKLFPVHYWILFDGEIVGCYWGWDLENLRLEEWVDYFPGDPNPIQIVALDQLY